MRSSTPRQQLLRIAALAAAGVVALLTGAAPGGPAAPPAGTAPAAPAVACTRNTDALPPFEVFELAFAHENNYANPFFDATVEVSFTGPEAAAANVGGFFYGSADKPAIDVRQVTPGRKVVSYRYDKHNLWKARLAPWKVGTWKYQWTFTDPAGRRATGQGAFECVQARYRNSGFVRQHPDNPFRWVFDDGSPYFPVGLQECLGDGAGTGSWLAGASLEGPFRQDRNDPLPPGPMFKRGPSNNPLNGDVYFRRYAKAGFNLFRFSQANCSPSLFKDLDHYLVHEARATDELLAHARKYRMRVMYGLFGYKKVLNDHPEDEAGMAKVKRFVKYSVDRWGAYVDFWEFLNEQKAADRWYAVMTPYLKSIDPYRHPVTTSWQRPELAGIDINAPHWYTRENELSSDAAVASAARNWKGHGKPVIVGEHGNKGGKPTPDGKTGVWDVRSAIRMRLRLWTGTFNEIAFIFWNTSYAKDGHSMNMWLGPRERQYVAALQCFSCALDKDVRPAKVEVSVPKAVRGWALASKQRAGVYLHHYAGHDAPVRGVKVTLDVPAAGKAYWYRPEDAVVISSVDAPAGRGTFAAPDFAIDLALLVTPDGPPDIDHDGKANDVDEDNDNDGVPNAKDAYPLEDEESADRDGDMVGDVIDADDDGDGIGDDDNHDGVPDCQEMDIDGDGVPKSGAVPWDAFPWDPKEWRDTDGDGIGDNADTDDDGDGWSDAEELKAGTDPLNKLSFPREKRPG